MKQIVLVLLPVIGLASHAIAQNKPDFRSFYWGNSFEQVQSDEPAKYITMDKDDMLEYQDNLGGYECEVVYIFNENDKLISGNYMFTKKYTNPGLYLQDYHLFKNLLIQKYGKPSGEEENWKINNPSKGKENLGQAISEGSLSLNTEWITDRSTIEITLSKSGNQPLLHIHYTSKSLDELVDKEELQEALAKL